MAQITALSPIALPGPVYSFVAKDEAAGGADLDGTYYWDATLGDDGNDGSIGSPFQTVEVLNEANSIAAGTTCNFKRGESFGEIDGPAFDGSSGSSITLQDYGSGNLPVFTADTDAVIDLAANDYWTVKNLRLTGGLQPGVNKSVGGGVYCAGGNTGVILDGLTIDTCYGAGVLALEVHTFTVQNCTISGITSDGGGGHGDAIDIRPASADSTTPSTNVTIDGNTISGSIARQGIAFEGVTTGTISDNTITISAHAEGDYAIDLEPIANASVTGITISGNTIDVTDGHGIGLGGDAAGATVSSYTITENDIDLNNSAAHVYGISLLDTDGTLAQNVVSENAITGCHWCIYADGVGTLATIKHNQLTGPHADSVTGIYVNDGASVEIFGGTISGHDASIIVYDGTSEAVVYNVTMVGWRNNYGIGNWVTLTVRNCIFYATAGNSGLMIRDHGTLDVDYNCFYDEDDAATWRLDANTYSSLATWQAASSQDANSTEEDPKLSDVDNGDFTLEPTSPALTGAEDVGDDYKWGLSPGSVFPDSVVLRDRDTWGWGRGAHVGWSGVITSDTITSQPADDKRLVSASHQHDQITNPVLGSHTFATSTDVGLVE
jgi:hypothetical protein